MVLRAAPHERWAELAKRMHNTEHAGDGTTHVIIEQLDRSFVTPFVREDIYRLAGRLDDVIDHIDAAVDLATLYRAARRLAPTQAQAILDVLTWAAEQQRLATEPAGAMPDTNSRPCMLPCGPTAGRTGRLARWIGPSPGVPCFQPGEVTCRELRRTATGPATPDGIPPDRPSATTTAPEVAAPRTAARPPARPPGRTSSRSGCPASAPAGRGCARRSAGRAARCPPPPPGPRTPRARRSRSGSSSFARPPAPHWTRPTAPAGGAGHRGSRPGTPTGTACPVASRR
ncbi:MAG: DUF47 family protein [Micromonosporaceae bacterium]|nr:DUF47 family protein [Micromonosporaceae bacterium]